MRGNFLLFELYSRETKTKGERNCGRFRKSCSCNFRIQCCWLRLQYFVEENFRHKSLFKLYFGKHELFGMMKRWFQVPCTSYAMYASYVVNSDPEWKVKLPYFLSMLPSSVCVCVCVFVNEKVLNSSVHHLLCSMLKS